ncbi:pseudouridine synthase [Acidicapsa dinghuensis]|uniref:Pseudouridine synthase n=1 Tax=Acidicapsa dinghuensis TaxID=2218256 RepID=A0ABW1EBV6_9BACT|nr:pseudouridine synthase [Acidicapsa dinghuensis]
MSPEPKKTLKIEPIDPKEDAAESAAKRRSNARKNISLPAKPKSGIAADSIRSSSKKVVRKPSRQSSAPVEDAESVSQSQEIDSDSASETLILTATSRADSKSAESLEQDAVAAELARQVEAEAEDEPGFIPPDTEDSQTQEPSKRIVERHEERLQKILSHAGISSRRTAEEMILGGRVQVNGQVVSTLGAKADPQRDHIRVNGKLLQGPERHRYFMLNKPKGYVTTVSDPEGRPTVMKFFAGERERLYPIGRLDYLSEGLLLVTNDGELANKLTRASSGVEKTYLVKVSGNPDEEMIESLREGVMIERGRPGTGSGRVRTAPASIRQVREGDNPWYEVTVIEGRNRELRKMFEEIGHHVEKIRRVGYGPLILDLEPGKVRELDEEEIRLLNLAADGKLKTRRRRGPAPAQLSRHAGAAVEYQKAGERPRFKRRTDAPSGTFRSRTEAGNKPFAKREDRPGERSESRFSGKPSGSRFAGKPGESRFRRAEDSRRPSQDRDRPQREGSSFDRPGPKREGQGFQSRSFGNRLPRPARPTERPFTERPSREDKGFEPRRRESSRPPERRFESRPATSRPRRSEGVNAPERRFEPRPGTSRPGTSRPASSRPGPSRPGRGEDANEFDRRPPKKFAGDRPANRAPQKRAFDRPKSSEGAFQGKRRSGPPAGDGEAPRKKERWRDSYTGKNKGRPKPKPRKPE